MSVRGALCAVQLADSSVPCSRAGREAVAVLASLQPSRRRVIGSRIQPCDSDLPMDASQGRLIFLMEAGPLTAVTFKPRSVSVPHKPERSGRLITSRASDVYSKIVIINFKA